MTKILFICHGNICRSPMAEYIMKKIANENALDVYVESAATSTEEIGNHVYGKAAAVLRAHGIDGFDGKTARQVRRADYENFDLLIIMDSLNESNIRRIIESDPENKIRKLLSFTGADADIDDPWYTGEFERAYEEIERGCNALAQSLS
jgi:protein-tyrosine phosphatase